MRSNDQLLRMEEEFHGRERKQHRKDRKQRMAQDRSKFKKSDQDQQTKQWQPPLEKGALRGRVLAISSEGISVESAGSYFLCSLKGSLKKEVTHQKNLVAVGDFVHFFASSSKEGSIGQIEPRTSFLARADNLSRQKEQLIAVNIDQVLITVSVVSPPIKPFLIDRYLIAAIQGNMTPIIVINKIDLLSHSPAGVDKEFLAQEQAIYDNIIATYTALDVAVYPVSTQTNTGIEALKKAMRGKTSLFSGQSGVGKSSLINTTLGTELKVGDIVLKTQKGTHTTTTTHLIPLEGGGFCVDTPGIKSFGLFDLNSSEIQHYFPEIFSISCQCKYADCTHLAEPGCAVQRAIEEKSISLLRFASYSALMAEAETKHLRR